MQGDVESEISDSDGGSLHAEGGGGEEDFEKRTRKWKMDEERRNVAENGVQLFKYMRQICSIHVCNEKRFVSHAMSLLYNRFAKVNK